MTLKPIAPVQIARQEQYAVPAQTISPPIVTKSMSDKPRTNAALLISRSLEQVRRFEEKLLTDYNENTIDARVIESKIEAPALIFIKADQTRQYQRTDGNIWIKMASIFGGHQCFVVRPSDPLESFDQGAWYLARC